MASKVIKDILSQLFINIKSNKNKPMVTFLKRCLFTVVKYIKST